MNSLSQALQKAQTEVIGLFKNRMSKQTEMVLSAEKDGMVKTIFPDNKNLYEMAYGDALAFHDFI
jgi:hypothetical protein